MNKNTGIIIGIIVLVVIVGGVYASKKSNENAMMVKQEMKQKVMTDKKVLEENAVMKNDDSMMQKDSGAIMKKEDTSIMKNNTMMKVGSYEAYSPEKIAMASTDHDVVLFFKANWCPSCRTVDTDIKANLSKIPEDLTILDVDYDNSKDLKKKYGVTYQHTFVQVDKDGNLIKKWSGSPTLKVLVSEIK